MKKIFVLGRIGPDFKTNEWHVNLLSHLGHFAPWNDKESLKMIERSYEISFKGHKNGSNFNDRGRGKGKLRQ